MSRKSFEQFYHTHFDKIYRFVFFRVGGNKELAEDLVSEIFLKALKNFTAYEETKSKSAWIFTIAKNHLANHFRDHQKKSAVSLEAANEAWSVEVESREQPSTAFLFDGFEQFVRKDAERELMTALSNLSEEKRRLVTMKYLVGYSYTEMGEILEMSEGAVKVATHRAMKELKEKMKKN